MCGCSGRKSTALVPTPEPEAVTAPAPAVQASFDPETNLVTLVLPPLQGQLLFDLAELGARVFKGGTSADELVTALAVVGGASENLMNAGLHPDSDVFEIVGPVFLDQVQANPAMYDKMDDIFSAAGDLKQTVQASL